MPLPRIINALSACSLCFISIAVGLILRLLYVPFAPLSELFFLFRTVFLYHQVVYDEVLSLGRILAHVVL